MASKNEQVEFVELEILPEDDLLDTYYKTAIKGLRKTDSLDFADFYLDVCNSGENRFYQKNITETKFFDEVWVKTLESFFPSIDKIIKNPKLTIRYEEEVVAIEKAKKTNSASVRHLASHTQLIREVDKDGFVKPKSILTTFAEEEIATYENRFIMTLINRLFNFVRARHEIIKENVESYQNDHLYYISTFDIKDETVEFKLDINIKRDLDNPSINKKNYELLARVERLLTFVSGFKNSQFMQALKKAKKVNPPIMKTNVILKNPDFKNAYALWLFLDKYNSLGYDIDVRERPVRLSSEFKRNLDRISALSYSALVNNKKKRHEDFRVIEQVEPIIKKSTKVVKTLASDVIKRPDAIQIEDNLVNEYFLELNKKVLNSRVKELVEEKISKEQASKKIVKESLTITNAMFDSVFNLEENIDYFEKFVSEEDPTKSYNDAKFKVKIAKAIREAKESDLKKSIKLEKSLYKTMLKASNAKLRQTNLQKQEETFAKFKKQLDADAKKYQKEKRRIKDLIEQLDGKVIDIETNKQQIVLEKEAFDLKLEQEITYLKEEFKKYLKEELDAMKKAHREEVAKQKTQMKEDLKKAEERKKLRLKKMEEKKLNTIKKETEKQNLKKENEINKYKEAIQKELEDLKNQRDEINRKILELDGKIVDESTGKLAIEIEKELFDEDLYIEKEIIKEIAKEELEAEISEIKAKYEVRINKIKTEYEEKIRLAEERKKARLAKLKEKKRAELEKEKNKIYDKNELEKVKTIAKCEQELNNEINKLENKLNKINSSYIEEDDNNEQ
ncbi:MAG: hypothetical protein IJ966_00595 [Bacilli bacterium]|nr:hypothetical protein [Bacilli bacterium]